MKTLALFFLALATSAATAQTVSVSVMDGNQPVLNAKVALILKSGAYQVAPLAGNVYACQPPGPCVKVFAAAPGYEGACVKVGTSPPPTIVVTLKPSTTKNSTIIESSGTLAGIDGRVNPILDSFNRRYLYTKEIGLLDGTRPAQQPIQFALKREIDAETATGKRFKIWVVDITQRVSLLEYTMPQ